MQHHTITKTAILAFACFLASIVENIHTDMNAKQLEIELTRSQIVPDVLRLAPRYKLKLKYRNRAINLGNKLSPFDIKIEPSSFYWPTRKNTLYTLVFTDPDVPSKQNPEEREWIHWIVANIPKIHVDRGDVLAQYVGGIPSHLGTWHRYVFIVFEQKGKEDFSDWMPLDSRPIKRYRARFSTLHFASKYNLSEAIAVNYFMSSNLTLPTTIKFTPAVSTHITTR